MEREEVIQNILQEVDYGHKLWEGSDTQDQHSPEEWVMYMKHYLNDCEKICSTRPSPEYIDEVTDQLRKVMAMGMKCLIQHGCPKRVDPPKNKLSNK